MEPRIGMRYGKDWYLKPGFVFSELTNALHSGQVQGIGMTPRVPSLQVATKGVHDSYQGLVMGTDPEFFLQRDGKILPAFDVLPDKRATTDGLFWDGFQAETTVDLWEHLGWGEQTRRGDPTAAISCHAILAQRLGRQLSKLQGHGLQIAPQSVWRIPKEMLEFASEAHVQLGCDPSRNVYGIFGRAVARPRELAWRFAGGHVHFNMQPAMRADKDNVRYLVKTLDALLGIPCVCLAQNYDHFIRRRYYGLAGEYRLPQHGLEYRTLSNFWLMDPRAFGLVFDLARHAFNIGQARLRNVFTGPERAVRDTINFCDVRSAKDFMRLNKDFYSAWTSMLYNSSKPFWQAIEGGIDKVIPGWGKDVLAAWELDSDWRKVKGWRDLW